MNKGRNKRVQNHHIILCELFGLRTVNAYYKKLKRLGLKLDDPVDVAVYIKNKICK